MSGNQRTVGVTIKWDVNEDQLLASIRSVARRISTTLENALKTGGTQDIERTARAVGRLGRSLTDLGRDAKTVEQAERNLRSEQDRLRNSASQLASEQGDVGDSFERAGRRAREAGRNYTLYAAEALGARTEAQKLARELLKQESAADRSVDELLQLARATGQFSNEQVEAARAATQLRRALDGQAANFRQSENAADGFADELERLVALQRRASQSGVQGGRQGPDPSGGILSRIGQIEGNITPLFFRINQLAAVLQNIGQVIQGIVRGAQFVFEQGQLGAEINQTADSFENLQTNVLGLPDLMDRLSEAAGGTISNFQIQASTLTLLAGASNEIAPTLANASETFLLAARAANRLNPALGDTTFLYESISKGVLRTSPLILDNLGIVVRASTAYRQYAAEIGVSVNELTENQRRLAFINETQKASNLLIERAALLSGEQADSFQQLTVAAEELANQGRSLLADVLTPLVQVLAGTAGDSIFARAETDLARLLATAGAADFTELSGDQQGLAINRLLESQIAQLEERSQILGGFQTAANLLGLGSFGAGLQRNRGLEQSAALEGSISAIQQAGASSAQILDAAAAASEQINIRAELSSNAIAETLVASAETLDEATRAIEEGIERELIDPDRIDTDALFSAIRTQFSQAEFPEVSDALNRSLGEGFILNLSDENLVDFVALAGSGDALRESLGALGDDQLFIIDLFERLQEAGVDFGEIEFGQSIAQQFDTIVDAVDAGAIAIRELQALLGTIDLQSSFQDFAQLQREFNQLFAADIGGAINATNIQEFNQQLQQRAEERPQAFLDTGLVTEDPLDVDFLTASSLQAEQAVQSLNDEIGRLGNTLDQLAQRTAADAAQSIEQIAQKTSLLGQALAESGGVVTEEAATLQSEINALTAGINAAYDDLFLNLFREAGASPAFITELRVQAGEITQETANAIRNAESLAFALSEAVTNIQLRPEFELIEGSAALSGAVNQLLQGLATEEGREILLELGITADLDDVDEEGNLLAVEQALALVSNGLQLNEQAVLDRLAALREMSLADLEVAQTNRELAESFGASAIEIGRAAGTLDDYVAKLIEFAVANGASVDQIEQLLRSTGALSDEQIVAARNAAQFAVAQNALQKEFAAGNISAAQLGSQVAALARQYNIAAGAAIGFGQAQRSAFASGFGGATSGFFNQPSGGGGGAGAAGERAGNEYASEFLTAIRSISDDGLDSFLANLTGGEDGVEGLNNGLLDLVAGAEASNDQIAALAVSLGLLSPDEAEAAFAQIASNQALEAISQQFVSGAISADQAAAAVNLLQEQLVAGEDIDLSSVGVSLDRVADAAANAGGSAGGAVEQVATLAQQFLDLAANSGTSAEALIALARQAGLTESQIREGLLAGFDAAQLDLAGEILPDLDAEGATALLNQLESIRDIVGNLSNEEIAIVADFSTENGLTLDEQLEAVRATAAGAPIQVALELAEGGLDALDIERVIRVAVVLDIEPQQLAEIEQQIADERAAGTGAAGPDDELIFDAIANLEGNTTEMEEDIDAATEEPREVPLEGDTEQLEADIDEILEEPRDVELEVDADDLRNQVEAALRNIELDLNVNIPGEGTTPPPAGSPSPPPPSGGSSGGGSFMEGGLIPGQRTEPRLIEAHGGEFVVPSRVITPPILSALQGLRSGNVSGALAALSPGQASGRGATSAAPPPSAASLVGGDSAQTTAALPSVTNDNSFSTVSNQNTTNNNTTNVFQSSGFEVDRGVVSISANRRR